MKIQYCSDLHLEFRENKEFLKSNPLQPKGEILLLAGDIVPFAVMDKHADFFDYVADNFETTYWVPGNHEYYHSDISNKSGHLNEKIRNNVFLVNNLSVKYPDIKIVFSTLWTKISPTHQWSIQQSISDFQVIRHQANPFTPFLYNQLYEQSLQFLRTEVNQEKAIIVTHHVPTFMNYPDKYRGSLLNEAFAVDLHDFIETSTLEYWLFGHHHTFVQGFSMGKTKLITNQLGYVKYNEHRLFKCDASIDL
ncbi:MAG: metallophosphoesterase [Bacteroidales bacterium]|nr:metallophosphoesterase [Bacteroidales bacterium]